MIPFIFTENTASVSFSTQSVSFSTQSVSFSIHRVVKRVFSLCSHVHPLQGTSTNKPARFVHTLWGFYSTIPSYNTPSIVFNRLNLLKLYHVRRFRRGVITSSTILLTAVEVVCSLQLLLACLLINLSRSLQCACASQIEE